MLVQQVLAAWRTATAGRPKGEDLYSPRKDLGADLRRAAPAARGPGALDRTRREIGESTGRKANSKSHMYILYT